MSLKHLLAVAMVFVCGYSLASTRTIDGRIYPLFDGYKTTPGSFYCLPGQTLSYDNQAVVNVSTDEHWPKSRSREARSNYTPPLGWAVSKINRVELSKANRAEFSVIKYRVNNAFNHSDVDKHYDAFFSWIDSASGISGHKKNDLKYYAHQFLDTFKAMNLESRDYYRQLQHYSKVSGNGIFKGRSWYHAYLYGENKCVQEEFTSSKKAISTVVMWVEKQVRDSGGSIPSFTGPKTCGPNSGKTFRLNIRQQDMSLYWDDYVAFCGPCGQPPIFKPNGYVDLICRD